MNQQALDNERDRDLEATLRRLETADEQFAIKVLTTLEGALSKNRLARDAIRRCRILMNGEAMNVASASKESSQLASMLFAVGTTSADGSATLGHNGYLYLTEGSNFVLSRYERERSSSEILAKQWLNLFDDRKGRQERAGRKFIQFIVPEKLSTLPDYVPFPLKTPTDALSIIEENCKASNWDGSFFSVLDLFRSAGSRCSPRLDSHQSTYGSYSIANRIASYFGYQDLRALPFTETAVRSGDLAFRFFGVPIYEVLEEPQLRDFPCLLSKPHLIETHEPTNGGHLGVRCVWRNTQAPIKLRVVAFGNSCFERGGIPLLSWWFSRIFEEFHFCWSNTVDDEYAETIRADVVIGQTMERFLFVARVPEA